MKLKVYKEADGNWVFDSPSYHAGAYSFWIALFNYIKLVLKRK